MKKKRHKKMHTEITTESNNPPATIPQTINITLTLLHSHAAAEDPSPALQEESPPTSNTYRNLRNLAPLAAVVGLFAVAVCMGKNSSEPALTHSPKWI